MLGIDKRTVFVASKSSCDSNTAAASTIDLVCASLSLRAEHWQKGLEAHLSTTDPVAATASTLQEEIAASGVVLRQLSSATEEALKENAYGVPLAMQLKDARDRVRRLQRVHDEKAGQMKQAERELAKADAQLQEQRKANKDAVDKLNELIAEQTARNAQCADRCTQLERQLRLLSTAPAS